MCVFFRDPRPGDKSVLLDNLLSACMEMGLEGHPVSVGDTERFLEDYLQHPTARMRVVIAEEKGNFAGHLMYAWHFMPEINTLYPCVAVRVVEGFRSKGIGRRLVTFSPTLAKRNIKSLFNPACKHGLDLARSLGLRATRCRLRTRTISAHDITSFRDQHSVSVTSWGEVAIVLRSNEAFEIKEADNTDAIRRFIVSRDLRLWFDLHGVSLDRRLLNEGVSAALGGTGREPEDGRYYIATRYQTPEEPIAFLWIFREPSPYRSCPRVYIRGVWIDKEYRRRRLARPFIESAVALFCAKEKSIELRVLQLERPHVSWRAWEATTTSLGLQDKGTRLLLEP